MSRIWYLAPTSQGIAIGTGSNPQDLMYLLIDEITPHLDRAGVCFHVEDRKIQLKHHAEIAEVIARVIIEADGKDFVPVTKGECVDEAVKLGLFPRNTRWNETLTKEDAAELLVRLKNRMERGCLL